MEIIKDIFDGVSKRLKSPFVSSFVISWFVANWKIVLAIFIDDHNIKDLGYSNLFEFISTNLDWRNTLAFPTAFAVVYVFGMPYLRRLIAIHTNKVRLSEAKKIMKDSETVTVPVSELREQIELRKKTELDYSELIAARKSEQKQVQDLMTKLNEISKDRDEKAQENISLRMDAKDMDALAEKLKFAETRLKNIINSDILNGSWSMATGPLFETEPENIRIDNDIITKWIDNKYVDVGYIFGFHFTGRENSISFIKIFFEDGKTRFFQDNLTIAPGKTSIQLSGTEIELPWGTEAYPILYSSQTPADKPTPSS